MLGISILNYMYITCKFFLFVGPCIIYQLWVWMAGIACHCGIAIRSRNSLFVLRTCETISRNDKYLLQQPVTELKSCDDSDLLIDQHGNEYKVVCYGEFST